MPSASKIKIAILFVTLSLLFGHTFGIKNLRPIIGILTQPVNGNSSNYS